MTTIKPLRFGAAHAIATVSVIGAVAAGAAVAGPSAQAAPQPRAEAASSAAAYCGITWGSGAKNAGTLTQSSLTGVRAGRHACFDRIVLDVDGRTPPGYSIGYVSTVRAEGSGAPIPLRGSAKLRVQVLAPTGFTPVRPTEMVPTAGYRTLRQVAFGGSFEGYTTIGVGVRARLPFRVTTIDDGATSRLVIDVAHRW